MRIDIFYRPRCSQPIVRRRLVLKLEYKVDTLGLGHEDRCIIIAVEHRAALSTSVEYIA